MPAKSRSTASNRYSALIERVFLDNYRKGATEVRFARSELRHAAKALKIELPKNLGDVVYSMRYRTPLPPRLVKLQPAGFEWVIEGEGRSRYLFKLSRVSRITPNRDLVVIKIPDATPEIIAAHAFSDEQALLAKVRYNRLIDIFLGIATYSLQNHLRTTVPAVGQIEIDEIYVGVDQGGRQFVIPVQAKVSNDHLSSVQAKQDIRCCAEKFPHLICRAMSAHFMSDDKIALFELALENDEIRVVQERHYLLVNGAQISPEDLNIYSTRS